MTKKKMVLEHLVVGRLKAQNINQVQYSLDTNALDSLVMSDTIIYVDI